jgi:hypothetical protein
MSLPAFGDFNGLNLPKWDREMIESGFKAVSSVEGGWDFLKSYSPPKDQGFMFSASVGKRKEIDDAIDREYGGHSGGSYGQTMRILEFIAKQGWEAYAKKMLDEHGPPSKISACHCRIQKGYTTGWCGVAGGGVPACDH